MVLGFLFCFVKLRGVLTDDVFTQFFCSLLFETVSIINSGIQAGLGRNSSTGLMVAAVGTVFGTVSHISTGRREIDDNYVMQHRTLLVFFLPITLAIVQLIVIYIAYSDVSSVCLTYGSVVLVEENFQPSQVPELNPIARSWFGAATSNTYYSSCSLDNPGGSYTTDGPDSTFVWNCGCIMPIYVESYSCVWADNALH